MTLYSVWFHGQGRRPRRPRCLYSGTDPRLAHGVFGAARLRMARGRLVLYEGPHESRVIRRGAR